jgi:uncharacterized protein YbaR (Trm112 family)
MAISKELLDILLCPDSKQPLTLADPALLETLNQRIRQGTLKNRGGTVVSEPIDGGLVRQDRRYLYPIRDDIPIMLIDEAIPLQEQDV